MLETADRSAAVSAPVRTSTAPGEFKISDQEFTHFQRLILELAGISLSAAKKPLLVGRLSKRLKLLGIDTFGGYFRHITMAGNGDERQMAVDLLTTNETYFFRESKHFDFIAETALRHRQAEPFRVWSAASSSGEEAYSVAMVLAEKLQNSAWEVIGTDISMQVLSRAQRALYPVERAEHIPLPFLKKHCLKGLRDQAGQFLIAKHLRERVRFLQSNLLDPVKELGKFDVIMLRNVMIYFDTPTKQKVVANLLPYLKEGGHFIVGHSESLNGLAPDLLGIQPTISRLVQR